MCNTSSNPQVISPYLSDEITYNLWAQPDDAWWARSFVSIPRNHIRAINRNTRRDHEHSILHLSDDLTYFLLANKQGDTISISFSIYLFTSHTFCRRKTSVMMGTSISIQPMSRHTSCGRIHRTSSGLLSGSIWRDHSPTVDANTRMQNKHAILDL